MQHTVWCSFFSSFEQDKSRSQNLHFDTRCQAFPDLILTVLPGLWRTPHWQTDRQIHVNIFDTRCFSTFKVRYYLRPLILAKDVSTIFPDIGVYMTSHPTCHRRENPKTDRCCSDCLQSHGGHHYVSHDVIQTGPAYLSNVAASVQYNNFGKLWYCYS